MQGAIDLDLRPELVGEDATLNRQLACADQIYIVVVGAPVGQLIEQLTNRSILLHVPVALRSIAGPLAPSLRRLESVLPHWVSAHSGKLLGRRWKHRSAMREINDYLAALYAKPGAVEAIYRHWMTTQMNVCGSRISGPVLYVEPMSGRAARGKFRRVYPTAS